MPSHENGPRSVATDSGAEVDAWQQDRPKSTSDVVPTPDTAPAVSHAAATFRGWAARTGIALAPLGVRPEGPLGWGHDLPDRVEYREDEVTVARRRVLARRRLAATEREHRLKRECARYWTDAA